LTCFLVLISQNLRVPSLEDETKVSQSASI
jgi:hypothetical protein